jgi:hypothetical protein
LEAALIEQIFSDGIGTISIAGGTVRLDLITFSPTEKDAGGQPKAVFQQRIVMTADAFVRSAEKVQEAAQVLAKLAANARPSAGAKAESESLQAAEPIAAGPLQPPPQPAAVAPSANEPAKPVIPPKRPFP